MTGIARVQTVRHIPLSQMHHLRIHTRYLFPLEYRQTVVTGYLFDGSALVVQRAYLPQSPVAQVLLLVGAIQGCQKHRNGGGVLFQ